MKNTSYPQIAHFPPEIYFPAPKGCGKYSDGIGHFPPESATSLENQTQKILFSSFHRKPKFRHFFHHQKQKSNPCFLFFPTGNSAFGVAQAANTEGIASKPFLSKFVS
jgi:hypothetical protein